jgi:hypothetical protein
MRAQWGLATSNAAEIYGLRTFRSNAELLKPSEELRVEFYVIHPTASLWERCLTSTIARRVQ